MKRRSIQALILLSFFSIVLFTANISFAGDKAKYGPWIGVYVQQIDEDMEEAFNLSRSDGIVIVDVLDGSPAEEAGLRKRDIIVNFNGKNIDGSTPLRDFVLDTEAGDEVDVVYVRNGKEKTAVVKIGNRPKSSAPGESIIGYKGPGNYAYSFISEPSGYIGVGIMDLNDQLGEYFGVEDGEGVLVTEVQDDSPAQVAGIKAGDVITGVDGEDVNSTDELREIIGAMEEGDRAEISYLRDKRERTVTVEIAEHEPEIHTFSAPRIRIPSPGSKSYGLRWFGDDDFDIHFDDQRSEIDKLRKEIKKLQEEISKIKEKLE
ncbi:MAG: PDZ domain-containing protein [candidate division Zixibacteria bacterium]